MKKVLFPLVTALMVGCLPMQSVMAKKPQVTNNYDRDLKICTDSVKNIKINPPDKVYRYEETKVYRYKNDFSFSYPREYHLEKMGTAWNEGRDGLIIYDPYNWKYRQCKKSNNIQDDEPLHMADISIIKAPNLQQYKNSMQSYAYSDFRIEKSNNGYQIAKYISHGMNELSCVAFEHPRNLYLVEVCGLLSLNARSVDDKPAFDRIVSKFCFLQPNNDTLQDCGIWNDLKRDEVAQRLDELINNPKLLHQRGLNLCGPAAFFHIWLKRDPEAVRRYVTELYNTGSGHIGNLEIKPSEKLRSQNFASLKIKDMKSTDWMMMTALRNSQNYLSDYKGTPQDNDDTRSSGAFPSELTKWLDATGLYTNVQTKTFGSPSSLISLEFYDELTHALKLGQPSQERDIILFIDFRMVRDDKSQATPAPNHFIVLTSPIQKNEKGEIILNYWSWGKEWGKEDSKAISEEQFKKFYWGGIVAETKK